MSKGRTRGILCVEIEYDYNWTCGDCLCEELIVIISWASGDHPFWGFV